jgi:hypothetical protein
MTDESEITEEPLESQEFYEVMQQYRCAPTFDQAAVIRAFEAVKDFIRNTSYPAQRR